MKFYNLKCETPGRLGPLTTFDRSAVPWSIKNLHVILDTWSGAEVLAVASCLLVTESRRRIIDFNFSGIIAYSQFFLETSNNFLKQQPSVELPRFSRMTIGANAFSDDFAITEYNGLNNQLIISGSALDVLQEFDLGKCALEAAYAVV